MDAVGTALQGHYSRPVMTDLTLSLLQDTGWYDVKYASAGWRSLGYHGGCAFARGTYEDALHDAAARPYLCEAEREGATGCLPDASGHGVCQRQATWDSFFRLSPVRLLWPHD